MLKHRNPTSLSLLCALMFGPWACAGNDSGDPEYATDAGPMGEAMTPDAVAEVVCDDVTHRALLPGPFDCEGPPETVIIDGPRRRIEVFKYEASHPLATEDRAFPCAASSGLNYEAPDVPTKACSKAGVRPWHSVRWDDADAACTGLGDEWRLCNGEELLRACEGPQGYTYSWGNTFDASACNIRDVFRAEGMEFASEAPSGAFEDCHTSEGTFDASGNLWEWTADRDGMDPRARTYQGAGWQTIAQRHTDQHQTCQTTTKLPGVSAANYANGFVGFRCCRDSM
ncbi:MAG: hypothetical protein EXR76_05765 [Myxococcales bacterium]|nr:hypothetical protein [Myxococcales bacterium]